MTKPMIKITKNLLRPRGNGRPGAPLLLLSECGEWLTNGHWMAKKSVVKCDFAPTDDRRPLAKAVLDWTPRDQLRAVYAVHATVKGYVPYRDDNGEIVAWLNPDYAAMAGDLPAFASDTHSPVYFGDLLDPVLVIMPVRNIDPLDPLDLKALRSL